MPALPKILVVDDKPGNLLALEAVLGEQYELVLAASGQEALAKLARNPDTALILLDVEMPGMDGIEVCKRIKAMDGCHEIPVIFITAIYTEDPFVKKGYKAGAIDYFGKPFDPDVLRLKVQLYTSFSQKTQLLKERERQLNASEELLRTGRKLSGVLESLAVGVIIADTSGRICQTNEEVLKILRSAERIQSDRYGDLLGWWDRDGRLFKDRDSPLHRALTTGEISHSEVVQIRCLDQSIKSVFVSASPLRPLEGGPLVGAVVVLQDVTAHKAIEARLESQIVQLVSAGLEIEQSA